MRRILLAVFALLLLLAGGGWWHLSRPFPAAEFADAPRHPVAIYASAPPDVRPLLSPFDLGVDPMDLLLLANFTGDPDSVYVGFEPQAFDDEVHGTGLLVLGWRTDGRVDVFHTPGLRLDSATYGIAGAGLHAMAERPFTDARFVIEPSGPDVELTFVDLLGRTVRLKVRESARPPRRTIGLLAPMGAAAVNPPALPLVLLHEFDFVRVSGSDVLLTIDETFHRLDRLPLRLNGARRWFLRYSPDPFIVTWNPERDAALAPLEIAPDGRTAHSADGAVRYDLADNGGHTELRAMHRQRGARTVSVDFSPAIPELAALAEGADVSGAFRIRADPSVGVVLGRWRITRRGDVIAVEAEPDGGWHPDEPNRTVRLIYRLGGEFQGWPRSYRYEAELRADSLGTWAIRAGWQRVEATR